MVGSQGQVKVIFQLLLLLFAKNVIFFQFESEAKRKGLATLIISSSTAQW